MTNEGKIRTRPGATPCKRRHDWRFVAMVEMCADCGALRDEVDPR